MHEGYSSHFVCVSVTTLAAAYLIYYVEIKMPLSFLCHYLHMHCVDFVENALFRSSDDIC